MPKINYDLRPVDTENIIYTRNRIRLYSILNIFGVLLYLNISGMFKQPHASWMHLIHILIQPMIFFISVADSSAFSFGAFIASIFAFVIDVGISILNFISVNRCFGQPSASCFDRLYEKSIWFALAVWMALFDFLLISQLYQLKTQLSEKDATEKKNQEMIKLDKEVPTWNSAEVYTNKIKVMNVFLLLFDVIYALTSLSYIDENPMFLLAWSHIFVDPFVLFSLNKTKDDSVPQIVRVIYIISLVCNVIITVLFLQMEINDIGKMLSLLITMVYVVTDMVQIMFASEIINSLENYKRYKNNL